MKIVIVDDEPLALMRLKSMLADYDAYDVIGEASDGEAALALVEQLRPDLVLMDINMPGMNGLEAAKQIALMETPPALVFTTAYSEFALEAFEAKADGYLLKPIREKKLIETIMSAAKPNLMQQQRMTGESSQHSGRSHISATVRNSLKLISVDDIFYFQADQKYVSVRHKEGEALIEEPLKELEKEFESRFIRIHRNALVALQYIEQLLRSEDGKYRVVLRGLDEHLDVSRRHVSYVKERLKKY